jgi:hypothetical protein
MGCSPSPHLRRPLWPGAHSHSRIRVERPGTRPCPADRNIGWQATLLLLQCRVVSYGARCACMPRERDLASEKQEPGLCGCRVNRARRSWVTPSVGARWLASITWALPQGWVLVRRGPTQWIWPIPGPYDVVPLSVSATDLTRETHMTWGPVADERTSSRKAWMAAWTAVLISAVSCSIRGDWCSVAGLSSIFAIR